MHFIITMLLNVYCDRRMYCRRKAVTILLMAGNGWHVVHGDCHTKIHSTDEPFTFITGKMAKKGHSSDSSMNDLMTSMH